MGRATVGAAALLVLALAVRAAAQEFDPGAGCVTASPSRFVAADRARPFTPRRAVVGPDGAVYLTGSVPANSANTSVATVKNASRTACLAVQIGPAEAPFQGEGTFVLRPREKLTLVVAFEPTGGGSFISTLEVRTSDPTRPQIDVALSGESLSFEKR